ncbi:hypothetical protein ABQE57_20915 [Mycolicibacterium elephantis]
MTGIEAVTLETPDPAALDVFHEAAFGPDLPVRARLGDAPASGFRGFTLSLVVPQPSTVDALVERGLAVAKSFGRKYVSFTSGPVTLALLTRRALAKNAGVAPDGAGSHRIVVNSPAGDFTDPDGFTWEAGR